MSKRILTQEDIDNNPELAENGLKAGDEIDIPEDENLVADEETDDTGGSAPPPNKERP